MSHFGLPNYFPKTVVQTSKTLLQFIQDTNSLAYLGETFVERGEGGGWGGSNPGKFTKNNVFEKNRPKTAEEGKYCQFARGHNAVAPSWVH